LYSGIQKWGYHWCWVWRCFGSSRSSFINCGKTLSERTLLWFGWIYNLYLFSYTRRWELAGEILNQIDWDWRLLQRLTERTFCGGSAFTLLVQ
jgi:hypothetical protein